MFDLIAGREKHLPSHATLPMVTSTVVQVIVVALLVMVPMLFVTDRLPEVPTMMAFVAAPPPPPPRPAPAVAKKPKPTPRAVTPVERAQFLAPIEEPSLQIGHAVRFEERFHTAKVTRPVAGLARAAHRAPIFQLVGLRQLEELLTVSEFTRVRRAMQQHPTSTGPRLDSDAPRCGSSRLGCAGRGRTAWSLLSSTAASERGSL